MDSFTATTTSSQLKLNLGCGYQPIPGHTNVDYIDHSMCDMVVDLNGPWPWEDNSVDEIFTSHVLEHVDDCIHFMKEAQRVLKEGGYIEIRVPHGWSTAAMGDPTHKRPFFICTFIGFCSGYTPAVTLNPQHDKKIWPFTFEMVDLQLDMQGWVKKLPFWKSYAHILADYCINAVHQITVVLKKK